jgi:dipeptidyl aminopeptidase/acylaminoacyl peptidase
MRKITFALLFVVCVATFLSADENIKRPMTADDALNMVRVGNAQISPDGRWIFFSKSELDWKDNKRKSKYYMIPADGGDAFQYIGEEGGDSFQFSPNGEYFTFKRSVEKKSQLFLMRTSGGEAVQLTKHKSSINSYKWSPDSSKIFFLAPQARSKDEEKEHKAGSDVIFVDEGPHGQREGQWRHLWVFDIQKKESICLIAEDILIDDFDISPDGKSIIFTAQFSNRRNEYYKSEIFLYNITDKKRIQLTTNKSPESSLSWAPDGQSFAFMATDDKEWLNRNSKIYIMNPATKKIHLLSGQYEGNIRGIFWTPDSSTILFTGHWRTNSNLYKIDVGTGQYKQMTDVSGTFQASSFSKDRKKMVYSFSDFDTPSDIYTSPVDTYEPIRLTNANPWITEEILLASMEVIRWKSVKDYEIEGLLHLPAGYTKGSRLPLMLNIHGGPAGCFTNSFRASYHIYAGLGYASLSPNVRGSSGYTDKLREGNTVHANDGIGKGDYWDLMNGVDLLIDQGIIDPDRMGLRGWSYGGILGGWTITQTDRFKAASIGAGVYDWSSEYGPGFNHDVRLWHIGGTPWDNPEAWREQSAYTHVKNVTTPTFLIHGMNDFTDTEAQSMIFFTAIKDIGKAPVRYIRVPREPHGFREPRHQRIRDIEEIKWMQKYILGVDWKPWERPKEKEEDEEKDEKKQS